AIARQMPNFLGRRGRRRRRGVLGIEPGGRAGLLTRGHSGDGWTRIGRGGGPRFGGRSGWSPVTRGGAGARVGATTEGIGSRRAAGPWGRTRRSGPRRDRDG